MGEVACEGDAVRTTVAFDDWDAASAVGDLARRSGSGDAQAWRAVEMARALLALPPGASLAALEVATLPLTWFADGAVRAAAGWNEWEGAAYINQEAWDELVDVLAQRDRLLGLPKASDAAAQLKRRAASAGYRLVQESLDNQPADEA